MKTTAFYLSILAITFFSVNTGVLAQKKAKDKVLVNKVFIVEMAETTGKKVGKKAADEISFKSEKLNSKFMTKETGFPAALYTVSDVDSSTTPPTITFISEGELNGENIKWQGTVTGNDIEGTAIISKKGKTKKEYAYTGAIKEKKGAKK